MKQNKLIYQAIIPSKISISLMEKGLLIPNFLGGKTAIFGNVTKNGYIYIAFFVKVIAIFGNVTKNRYITKITIVCPADSSWLHHASSII